MKGELLPHVFNQTGTDSSPADVLPSSAKKRKTADFDGAMHLYSDSLQRNQEYQLQTLQFQKEAREIQNERANTAREHLVAFKNAARVQAIKTWTEEVERFQQKRKELKKSLPIIVKIIQKRKSETIEVDSTATGQELLVEDRLSSSLTKTVTTLRLRCYESWMTPTLSLKNRRKN